jgi:hypothetical protein
LYDVLDVVISKDVAQNRNEAAAAASAAVYKQIKDVKKQKLAWCDSIGDLLCRIISLSHFHYAIPLL